MVVVGGSGCEGFVFFFKYEMMTALSGNLGAHPMLRLLGVGSGIYDKYPIYSHFVEPSGIIFNSAVIFEMLINLITMIFK